MFRIIRLDEDVEAIVLDPSHAGSPVADAAARLPCQVEWHEGFRLPRSELPRCAAYREAGAADLLAGRPGEGPLTPRHLGAVRDAGLDFQTLKQAWHCLARFGGPLNTPLS